MDKLSLKKKTDVDDDTTIRHVFIKFFFFFLIEGIISLMYKTSNDLK